jgi:hypothetical protein
MMGGDETFSSLASKVNRHMLAAGDSSAVVSVVFARPTSRVMSDVVRDFGYLDTATGPSWGLIFPGYQFDESLYAYRRDLGQESTYPRVYGPSANRKSKGSSGPSAANFTFNGPAFLEVAGDLHCKHFDAVGAGAAWSYSGSVDVVSIMAYKVPLTDDNPWSRVPEKYWPGELVKHKATITYDFASLRSITLTDSNDNYTYYNLPEYVEVMADWRSDGPRVAEVAPGEFLPAGRSGSALNDGLRFTATAIGSGVLGNYAYDLLKWVLS